MHNLLSTAFSLGSLQLPNRLIQGPLAGFSCAPFRELFYQFTSPAYCVSEMISAHDVIHKHDKHSRYLFRSPKEKRLAYQIAGSDAKIMAEAATRLEQLGADLIDLNCGCPKTKIRKKGAGSALLEKPEQLFSIIASVRKAIKIPLSVKIRIQDREKDRLLAKNLAELGIDALIVHGRRWTEDYDQPSDLEHIAAIKQALTIPVIANGDLSDQDSLSKALALTGCEAYMIARAGTGKPWLYQSLLAEHPANPSLDLQKELFLQHLQGLARLEGEYKALLQSKSLVRYYFRNQLAAIDLPSFYQLKSLDELAKMVTGWN